LDGTLKQAHTLSIDITFKHKEKSMTVSLRLTAAAAMIAFGLSSAAAIAGTETHAIDPMATPTAVTTTTTTETQAVTAPGIPEVTVEKVSPTDTSLEADEAAEDAAVAEDIKNSTTPAEVKAEGANAE
jgi:hypothetical protein